MTRTMQLSFPKRLMGRLFFGVLMAPAIPSAQEAAIEMWEEPRHQLVMEMDHLRLALVNVPAGDTSLFHRHRYATVYVLVSDALVAAQKQDEDWEQPGERPMRPLGTLMDRSDYVSTPFSHRVRNVDEHALQLVALVNVGSGVVKEKSQAAAPGSLLDNTWFREHRLSVSPATQSATLGFRQPAVVVQTSSGRSDAVPAGEAERPSIQNLKTLPGAWSWHEADRPFRLRNLGSKPVDFVIVEVKKPASAP